MIDLSDVQTVVLSKLGTELSKGVDVAPTGDTPVPFAFTVSVSGEYTRAEDTKKTPTSQSLTLEVLASILHDCGVVREHAIKAIVKATTEKISLGKDAKAALMQRTGVAEAMEKVKAAMEKLPKTPVKGAFKMDNVSVVSMSGVILGDSFKPHDDKADAAVPAQIEAK